MTMKSRYRTSSIRVALLAFPMAVALALLSACASAPVAPTVSLTEASQAIARAEQADGRQYAPGELDQAKQKMTLAERAVAQEDMWEAERLANEAKVTAELVLAKTESAKAAEINREMDRGTRALTDEMRRSGEM
jgi:hypothetical protein